MAVHGVHGIYGVSTAQAAIETILTNIHSHYVYPSIKEDHTHIPLKFHEDSLSILYMTLNYVP